MPYDLSHVLDEAFLSKAVRLRRATVVSTNPFTIRYGETDDPQPANRLNTYAPVAGHIVYVLQQGRQQGVVLGQLVSSTDTGGSVPIPPGGTWSANLLANGGFEYGFSTYGAGPFVEAYEWAAWALASGLVVGSNYAMKGSVYKHTDGRFLPPPSMRLVNTSTIPCVPGATYRFTGKAISGGIPATWWSITIGETQQTAGEGTFWWPDQSQGFNVFTRVNPAVTNLSITVVVPNDPRWKYISVSAAPERDSGTDPPFALGQSITFDEWSLQRKLA